MPEEFEKQIREWACELGLWTNYREDNSALLELAYRAYTLGEKTVLENQGDTP